MKYHNSSRLNHHFCSPIMLPSADIFYCGFGSQSDRVNPKICTGVEVFNNIFYAADMRVRSFRMGQYVCSYREAAPIFRVNTKINIFLIGIKSFVQNIYSGWSKKLTLNIIFKISLGIMWYRNSQNPKSITVH
jgi:hypothetical protein